MFNVPIDYIGRIYRPPSEARSFLLQVTIGCSNNKCTYCAMYRDKNYQVRSLKDIYTDIENSKTYFERYQFSPEKIFLCDGDALEAPFEHLESVMKKIKECFPNTRRVGIYATAQNMLDKSVDELTRLRELGLSIAYLGMESGCDKVLHSIVKGNTASDMIEGTRKLRAADWQVSIIAMLGIGGQKNSESHVIETARVISQIAPEFFSFLTTVAIPGTPLYKQVERGTFKQLSTRELFREMREMISQIDPVDSKRIIFRANHVSNMMPLAGNLPTDKEKLVSMIDSWISQTPQNHYPNIDPHHM